MAALSLIIERAIAIFYYNDLTIKDIHEKIMEFINKGDIKSAEEYCKEQTDKKAGAKLLLYGFKMLPLGEKRMTSMK